MQLLLVNGKASSVDVYVGTPTGGYVLNQSIVTQNTQCESCLVSADKTLITVGGPSNGVYTFTFNQTTGLFEPNGNIYLGSTRVAGAAYSSDIFIVCMSSSIGTIAFFECKVTGCLSCEFAGYCKSCDQGTTLINGKCLLPEQMICLDGKIKNGICVTYCSKKCAACVGSADNCVGCGFGRRMSQSGQCVPTNSDMNIIGVVYAILSDLRVSRVKFLFLLLDDYELYQYHRPEY